MKEQGNKMSGDWLIEVLSEIEESNHSLDFTSLFERLIDVYGLRTVAYLGTGISTDRPDEPYFITTYTDEWVAHYKSQGYVEVDPVIQLGMRRILPIDWKDFAPLNGEVRNLFVEAAAFGLGRQGLSIPVHGRHGDRALFSITSDVSDQEWSDARRRFMRDFQVLAINIHAMALRLHGGWDNKTNLSPVSENAYAG
ncbi:autoinducer binding domain-containing protein [Neoaquamicrobium sediminum]|uniref:autoinducer binding domain-containing protein n=1 Tax=Neoaquamicrobium sediminum TaxID=1849104 RepID=UPI0015665E3F|nr:autoinducer binding domain-containing protein [Mesorhizobium sediminum]NRC57205.1 autoinducer binding domain-containing protein [Mesorhizobium sediminum]